MKTAHAWSMHKLIVFLSCTLVLFGCAGYLGKSDAMQQPSSLQQSPSAQGGSVSIDVREHLDQIWLWDARPEFCLCIHGIDEEQDWERLEQLGVRFLRVTIYWDQMEVQPNEYSGGYLDTMEGFFREAKKRGFEVLVVVHSEPKYLNFSERQTAYEQFAGFMSFMVSYFDTITYWELWNEMDVGFTGLFGADRPDISFEQRGRYYAEMLKLAYPRIKEANPNAIVVLGGIASSYNPAFLEGVYKEGGKDYFDVANIHTYGVPVLNSFKNNAQTTRRVMEKYGDESKPLWNTEFGIEAIQLIDAWGLPPLNQWQDHGEYLDTKRIELIEECVDYAVESKPYEKYFFYSLRSWTGPTLESLPPHQRPVLPQSREMGDYGHTLMRVNGEETPLFEYLCTRHLNAGVLELQTVDISYPATLGVPIGYDYKVVDGMVQIGGVTVNSLYPTIIDLKKE